MREKEEGGGTTRPLRERQRQEREALILQVAEDVLREKGYYATSIDEIAARVGIAKGTVYLHFASKEDLIVAISQRDLGQLIAEIREIADTTGSARSKLEGILQALYGNFVRRMQLLSGMFRDVSLHQLKMNERKIMDLLDRMTEIIRAILEEGKTTGEFTTDIPTPVMVATFFSLLSPVSYQRLVAREQIEGAELARYLGQIYCRGIMRIDGKVDDKGGSQ